MKLVIAIPAFITLVAKLSLAGVANDTIEVFPATRFARFSWDLHFTCRVMSLKPPWSMVKSTEQREQKAKWGPFLDDEIPGGKRHEDKK